MDDLSGIGKSMNLKSDSTSLRCIMAWVSAAKSPVWKCDLVDCPFYGKWYCPFSGW
jgi:hypothetical protein